MSITQKDYLMRLLEIFAESLGRLLDLKARGKPREALDAVQETADGIFGESMSLIESLDPESVVDILVEPEKVATG
jgi:hypothetical protein